MSELTRHVLRIEANVSVQPKYIDCFLEELEQLIGSHMVHTDDPILTVKHVWIEEDEDGENVTRETVTTKIINPCQCE